MRLRVVEYDALPTARYQLANRHWIALATASEAGQVVTELAAVARRAPRLVTSPSSPCCWTSAESPTTPTKLEAALAKLGRARMPARG